MYAKGRLTRVSDPSGSTTYTYDAWGRVTTKRQTIGTDASARSFTVSYQYAAGRLTGITYPSGRSVSYAFDAQGRIAGVTTGGQAVLSGVGYLPFGAVQGWIWANGQAYRRSFDADHDFIFRRFGRRHERQRDFEFAALFKQRT